MIAYIYNTDTMDLVTTLKGESNQDVENQAQKLGYMGVDEFGLIYSKEGLNGF